MHLPDYIHFSIHFAAKRLESFSEMNQVNMGKQLYQINKWYKIKSTENC